MTADPRRSRTSYDRIADNMLAFGSRSSTVTAPRSSAGLGRSILSARVSCKYLRSMEVPYVSQTAFLSQRLRRVVSLGTGPGDTFREATDPHAGNQNSHLLDFREAL